MSERKEEPLKPTRKERRAAQREAARQTPKQKKDFDPSRRKFLKDLATAVLPGGWIPEARGKGITNISNAAKFSLGKDVLLTGGTGALLSQELRKEKSFKEKIETFTWTDASNPEKLRGFVDLLADKYLGLTKTKRVTKGDLTGNESLSLLPSTSSYIDSVHQIDPDANFTDSNWGYAHYPTRKVFINMEALRSQSTEQGVEAGHALIGSIWHEWAHLDVTERTPDRLLDEPNAYFPSPVSGKNERFRRYRGAAIYTDTYYGFIRAEEVLIETIKSRRLVEDVGLDRVFVAGDYYPNGVDFFSRFTSAVGISVEELDRYHGNSDLEGLATRIGSQLPRQGDSMAKGLSLLTGIHSQNTDLILNSGVFERIPQGW